MSDGFTTFGAAPLGSALSNILLAEEIVPGSQPSYQLCKTIYVSHILGGKMAEVPINMAQSQEREISVPAGPEGRLTEAFKREWSAIGKIGADSIIKEVVVLSRVYGIASVGVGDRRSDPEHPLEMDKIADLDLYFNVFDPLNTAGSLVLEQDPNSPEFMKPRAITVAGRAWHQSRTCVVMNEQPIYIEFNSASFGFVGRSVYQRALYPLKTVTQTMITDHYITVKCGLLIAMMKAAGAAINNRMQQMFGWKRQQLAAGVTGNVLSIGADEKIESLNLQNLEGPARFARENAFKNCATAAGMPAKILDQETLVAGFGEGAEDAKQIARYIDRMRIEMSPIYAFFDDIVMRRAWSPAFYKTLQADFPEYKKVPYLTAFMAWKNSFAATWPNLLSEPDSEKAKKAEIKFKSATATVEVLAPLFGPKNKANLARWFAEEVSDSDGLFTSSLEIDDDELDNPPEPPTTANQGDAETGNEKNREPLAPPPFAGRA
jgi:hypothetical protein